MPTQPATKALGIIATKEAEERRKISRDSNEVEVCSAWGKECDVQVAWCGLPRGLLLYPGRSIVTAATSGPKVRSCLRLNQSLIILITGTRVRLLRSVDRIEEAHIEAVAGSKSPGPYYRDRRYRFSLKWLLRNKTFTDSRNRNWYWESDKKLSNVIAKLIWLLS